MSVMPLVSPATRFGALDSQATWLPSALIAGSKLALLAWPPRVLTLTRSVVPVWRSRTKMSSRPLVSPATRFDPKDWKAT